MERNRVWTSDDLRALRAALRAASEVDGAASLDCDRDEVEKMLRDLGWIDAPPLPPEESNAR